jgi:DNA repair exonuclease SbcCD ATPase subunit
LFGLGTAAEAAGEAEAIAAAEKKANAEDEAAAMKKMDDLTQANAKAERKFAADREDIFTDEARAMEDANRKLSSNLADIASSLDANIGKINADLNGNLSKISADLASTLAELGANFADANVQAEREYQQQRADIVSSGAAEIAKIHQQTQKELEDAEREHSKNVASLIDNRDALGLAEENIAYAEKQAEIKRNADESIAQARANTQAQLAEAAQNYAEQRAQRLAEYQKQKADALAKAAADKADAQAKAAADTADAQAKAAEEKKKALEADVEQKAEIARKRAEALIDLKKAYDRERNERVTAVYNEIKDLKGALNAEMLMRRQYQDQILADTTKHMQDMAAAQGASSSPIHDYSGYAYTGTYAMAQDGQREFVLSGAATKAAEQMVGGQLNQQALLSGLAGQGGAGMQYVDQSTYSGMTVADVRRVRQMSRQEAIAVMSEVQRK